MVLMKFNLIQFLVFFILPICSFKQMSYDSLIQQVHEFFDQSNEPNIFAKDFHYKKSLSQVQPQLMKQNECKKLMLDIINSIIYLRSNMYFPTQIRFDYVVCDQNGTWGLRHAICYRSIQNSQSKDAYNPKQYNYHKTEENQLMWSLGKIWLRLFTLCEVSPIQRNQIQIHELINKIVPYHGVKHLLKKILVINPLKRISFQDFIQDQIFIIEEHPTSIKFMSSIAHHFSKLQSVLAQSKLYENLSKNDPYEQQIFKRNIKQSLEVANYFQGLKRFIKNIYQLNIDLEFNLFVITAMSYSYLKHLDQIKLTKGFIALNAPQRKFYSKFVHRMITLEEQVKKKLRIPKFKKLNPYQKNFLLEPQQIKFESFLPCYKSVFSIYYKTQSDMKVQNQSQKFKIDHQRRMVQFLLARSIFKIFSQARKYIFQDFTSANIDHPLLIGEVLQLVKKCQDPKKLKKFRERILHHFYQ